MLPCFYKLIFNVECIGCGLQRSILAILKGDFKLAFNYNPGGFLALFIFAFLAAHLKFNFKNGGKILLVVSVINLLIMSLNYYVKH